MTNVDAAKPVFRDDLAVGSDTDTSEEVAALETTIEPGAKTEETTEVKPEVKLVIQDEFNKVYFQRKQAERDKEALQQKVAELEARPTEAPKPEVTEPTLEGHDYNDDTYNAALIDFKVKQGVSDAISTFTQTQNQATAQQAKAQLSQQFDSKAAEYASSNPEYMKALEAAGNVQYSGAVNEVLLNSDNGPQLDHYLLSNPQKADEINRMSTVQVAMALAKVAVTFETKPQLSDAPAPIDVEGGGGGAVVQDLNDPNLSMEDYMQLTRGG